MPRPRKILLIALASAVSIMVALIFLSPFILRAFFYPKPHGLPSVVSQTTEQLLTQLQAALETNAPVVARSLQPGLTDAQIEKLEERGGFHLSTDLRALYHWHNGASTNSTVGLLAGQRFVPLDEIVLNRAIIEQESKSDSVVQRCAFFVFAGHRANWLQVLDDGAGDGYFYDPKRKEDEGAFFHHFAEDGYYMWFPSLRNFLAGVVECYQSQAVRIATDGQGLDEDYNRTEKIWIKFARSSE